MTSDDDMEIITAIKEILRSTDGLGLIHESVNSFDTSDWTRQWYVTDDLDFRNRPHIYLPPILITS